MIVQLLRYQMKFLLHSHHLKYIGLIFFFILQKVWGVTKIEAYFNDAKFAIIFKNDSNEHIEFEEWIPQDLPRVYVENYHITYNQNILDRICGEICLKELHLS